MDNKLAEKNKRTNIEKIFNSHIFKKEMEINIKQILIDRPIKCSFDLDINETECFTDGKRIIIGMLNEFNDLGEAEIFALIKALVGHEASHIKWSNFNDLKEFNKQIIKLGYNSNLAVSLANILEDGRIERLLCNYLKGYGKYIQYLNLILIYNDGNIDDNDFLTNIFNTVLFLSKLGMYPDNFEELFNKEEKDFITRELEPRILKAVSSSCHKDVFDATIDILDIISKEFPNIDLKNIQDNTLETLVRKNINPGYNTSEGQEEQLLSEEISQNNINSQDNTSKGFKMDLNACENDMKTTNTNNNECKKNTINNDENSLNDKKSLNIEDTLSELKEKITKEFKEILNSIDSHDKKFRNNADNNDDYFKNIDLTNINNNYNKDFLKEKDFKYEYADAPFTSYPAELLSDIKILEKQFKKILNNDNNLAIKQKRGKIDSSSLWKINTIYDNNIFVKKNLNEKSNYAVYILIDLSGSMDTKLKYKEAIKTAIKIEGSLMNLEGVEVKTVGFDYINRSRLRIFKDFNEKKSRTAYALNNSFVGYSNRDGFAIRVALEDLRKHNAKNKLLVVISDGRPAWDGESTQDAMTDVKNAVHQGRKENLIMSVLINEGNILDYIKDAFYYMYEDKGTIMVDIKNNPEMLTSSIVLYLKKLFRKR